MDRQTTQHVTLKAIALLGAAVVVWLLLPQPAYADYCGGYMESIGICSSHSHPQEGNSGASQRPGGHTQLSGGAYMESHSNGQIAIYSGGGGGGGCGGPCRPPSNSGNSGNGNQGGGRPPVVNPPVRPAVPVVIGSPNRPVSNSRPVANDDDDDSGSSYRPPSRPSRPSSNDDDDDDDSGGSTYTPYVPPVLAACTGGRVRRFGSCVCPGGQFWTGNNCACAANMVMGDEGSCIWPAVSATPDCPDGYLAYPGWCGPDPSLPLATCAADRTFNVALNYCECTAGTTENSVGFCAGATPAQPACLLDPCQAGCAGFSCPSPPPGAPSCFLNPCAPGCGSLGCPSGPPALTLGGPGYGGPGAATCSAGRFTGALSPLTNAVWVDAAAAADLVSREGAQCGTLAGSWLEHTPYFRDWAVTPLRPVLWAQSRLSSRPGSSSVELTPLQTPARRWTCTVGGTMQVDTPPLRRVAVEVSFTPESINAIESGRLQDIFPDAHVRQPQTQYCKAGFNSVTFEQDTPDLELIDPGEYQVQMRVCSDYACYATDAYDPISMAVQVTAAADRN